MPRFVLATWNLLHGVRVGPAVDGQPRPGEVDLDALVCAAAALEADVLGLQEVDRQQPRSGCVDQTAVVADAVGARWQRFVPAVEGTPGERWQPATAEDGAAVAGPTYGVGLVSRLPVREWRVLRFPPARGSMPLLVPGRGLIRVADEPRLALAAVVALPGGVGTVATCHLSFMPGVNIRQLRAVCRWLQQLPGPRFVIGDLNVPGRLPGVVTGWRQLARLPTYPSWRPRVQWDHALGRDVRAVEVAAAAVPAPVSDHRALRVVLRV